MEPAAVKVVDEPESSRFVLADDSLDGELRYHAKGNRLVLLHAEVAPSMRGKGVAGQLVMAAVDRARQKGETIEPRCGYTRQWLRDHPEQTAGVTIEWSPS